MKERLKAPELRFDGFTADWEQWSLGNVAKITMGQSPNSENYTENPSDFILVQGNADMKDGRVVPRVWTTQVTKTADKDDLILSVRAPVGDVGKTDYDVVLGRGVAAIKGNEFLFQSLGRMKQNGYWTKLSTGSTFESINSNDIKEAQILLPCLEEQTKIGLFFKQLDDTIALHQRKLDLLKEQKKGYLQKMFPKNGEKVPELRFEGFADAWEERKLETFTSLITKQTGFDYSATIKPALVNKPEGNVYPFIQNKNFSGFKINMNTDFYIPIEVAHKFPRITLDQPSLLVTISGNIGNVGIYNSDEKAFIGGAVGICKLNNLVEGEFILYELESDFGQRQFKSSTKSSSHANITVEMIKNIDILIPKNELEIEKIRNFFKELDDTIALHQRKLDLLKEQKKGYLQKMFI